MRHCSLVLGQKVTQTTSSTISTGGSAKRGAAINAMSLTHPACARKRSSTPASISLPVHDGSWIALRQRVAPTGAHLYGVSPTRALLL